MVQAPPPQYVRQCPLEQSRVQSPDDGHVSSQLPPEQSAVHGAAAHELEQLPEEHEHVPPEHAVFDRAVPVPGSATGGPPLGEPPPDVLPDPPPHAAIETTETSESKKVAVSLRKMINSFPRGGTHWQTKLSHLPDGHWVSAVHSTHV
jgi:hypothetical protein